MVLPTHIITSCPSTTVSPGAIVVLPVSLLLDQAEHLTGAPALIVAGGASGAENERRDRGVKLKRYKSQGVQEYGIANPALKQAPVYRREGALLKRVATLMATDETTSLLLPGFTCLVEAFFR